MFGVATFLLGLIAGIFMTELLVIIAIKLVDHNEEPNNKN